MAAPPGSKLIVGCGYLGQRVARLWHAMRRAGSVSDRSTPSPSEPAIFATTRHAPPFFAELDLTPIVCDILDPATLRSLPQVETVLFAVGFDRASGASMRDVYVNGLDNALSHLPPPRRFLYVSSTSVYGQADGGWVDEDSATEPEEESGRIVLAAETLLRSRLPGAVILRFAGIYGPGRLLRQKAIVDGEQIVGDGDRWLNLIHVEDGARAVIAAEERAAPGSIYNVCDGQPVPRRDFFTALAHSLHAPEPRFMTPPPDKPVPAHEKANRRIGNHRLCAELSIGPEQKSYVEGITASLSDLGGRC